MNNYLLFDFINMSIINHFKPNRTRVKTFLIVFCLFNVLNVVWIYTVGPFLDGPIIIGFPVHIYKFGCTYAETIHGCNTGFSTLGLLINLIFWYIVSTFIKRSK